MAKLPLEIKIPIPQLLGCVYPSFTIVWVLCPAFALVQTHPVVSSSGVIQES